MDTFNETEQEVIILNAIWEMIDGMVNYAMFEKIEPGPHLILMFPDAEHMQLFNVLLVDFLSSPQTDKKGRLPFGLPQLPSGARSSEQTHLYFLRNVCISPKLGADTSKIKQALDDFSTWLDTTATVERVWLSSIQIELDMNVTRIDFIKMCGNIAKHNSLRLSWVVKRLRDVMKDNGHIIDEGQAYLALPDFYEWFHDNIFAYHSSAIAEHLNNLRWELFDYLLPRLQRTAKRDDTGKVCGFQIPAEVSQPLAKAMYYELMNKVLHQPYMPRFAVSKYVKMRY